MTNPLLNAKPTNIYKNWEESTKLKLPTPYDRNKALFIEHMLPVLAKIPLYPNSNGDKISTTRTLQELAKQTELNTPNGTFPIGDIFALLKLAYKVNRSSFVAAAKKPHIASLTPLWMYAYKQYPLESGMGTKYEHWDKTDANIEVALGKWLYKAHQFQQQYPQYIRVGLDQVFRSAKLGNRKYTDYPNNLQHTEIIEKTEEAAYNIEIPKEWLILELQFWLAYGELRVPDAMILDMRDWDSTPKLLDAVVREEPKVKEVAPWL
jgi:hypothetical protein